MKRISLISLLFLYLIPAIGFSFNVHWCGGKVNSIKILSLEDDACICGEKLPLGCCKDVQTHIKLTDSYNAGSQISIPFNIDQNLIDQFTKSVLTFQNSFFKDVSHYHSPPIKCKLPVYVRACVFRI